MERIVVYPGTFDPITLGHLDVIKSGLVLADKLIVGIAVNLAKHPIFEKEERIMFIQESVKECGFENVEVECFSVLTVRWARQKGARIMIRGVRLDTNYEEELNLAFNNAKLDKTIETILIPPKQAHLHISSSVPRDLFSFNEHQMARQYLPPAVNRYLTKKRRELKKTTFR